MSFQFTIFSLQFSYLFWHFSFYSGTKKDQLSYIYLVKKMFVWIEPSVQNPTHKKMFSIPFNKIVTRNKNQETLTETSSVSGKMQQTKSKLSWHWFVPRLARVRFVFTTTQHNTDWRKKRHEIPTLPLYSLGIQIRTRPAIYRTLSRLF